MKKQKNENQFYILCRRYSDLNDEEIRYLADLEQQLVLFSEIAECDIYIDILNRYNKNEAIVVGESMYKNSMRSHSYLGAKIQRESEPAVLRTLETGNPSKHLYARTVEPDGEIIWTRQNVLPLKQKGRVIGTLILDANVNQQVEVSRKVASLKRERSTLSDILISLVGFDSDESEILQIPEGIMVFDRDGILSLSNRGARSIYRNLGFFHIEGCHFDDLILLPGDFENFRKAQKAITGEYHANNKYYNIRAVYLTNENYSAIVMIEDITDYKYRSLELATYLNYNREMQHRIKNNLQTICSMLRLQARECKSEEARQELLEAVNRVNSSAIIYSNMSADRNSQVRLLDSMKQLCDNYRTLYQGFYDIEFNVYCDDIQLPSDRMSTVILIVNELIQNSYKHAFAETKKGTITISAVKEIDMMQMVYIDDGNGCAGDVQKIFGSGLGTRLIKAFVEERLNGQWSVESGPEGTQFSFRFAV